jgi:LysR family transcriptional regulator, low CO2-responsive transcriptional regulator
MNYTLHQLQVFVKVVQLKSITKAGEELHLTQPAVSIQLKNLQEQFDIPLTEVIGRQLHITEFGMELYTTAERILNEVNTINNKTMSYKGFLTGRLVISSVSTGKYVMPYFLAEFIQKNKGVELVMDVTNRSKVLTCLKNNEVDFALVYVMPKDLNVHSEVLIDNALYLVGNKDSKKFKKTITKSELREMPIIFREEGSGTRFVMEEYFKRNQIHVQKKMELTSNEAVKQAVIAGLGNSIMPLIGIRNEIQNGDLRIIPAPGFPIRSKWRLLWLKGKKLSPAAEAYLDFIRTRKEEIFKNHFSWINKVSD